MLDNERDRIRHLHTQLDSHGMHLEDFLMDDYRGIVLHSSSTIITANQVLADLMGYAIEELEGMNAWNLFPPHSAMIVTEQLRQQSEEPYQVDARRMDGELVRVELRGINFELAGEPIRAILIKPLDSA